MEALAPLPVIVPLLVAIALLSLNRLDWRRLFDGAALAASFASFVFCCLLTYAATRAPIVYWFGDWRPREDMAVGIAFYIDPVGGALAALAALLTCAAFVFSWRYFESVGSLFHTLMLLFLAAMIGFFLTGDLFNLFVFFELMSAAAFALTGYKIEEKSPLQGSISFAVTNTVGASMILLGVALLYGRTGALNMADIGRALADGPTDGLVIAAWLLLTTGLFVKAALAPFHFWLADAHAVAPTPVCVLFSGIMVELGVYGAARVYWTMFAGTFVHHQPALQGVLLGLGVLTVLVCGVMCFGQRHIKRLLAFSSSCHVGMMLIGFALLTPTGWAGSLIYILGHGTLKGALFICAGILLNRFESLDECELHGRGRGMPATATLFFLGGLGLAGLPPFGTFWGKKLLEEAASHAGQTWLVGLLVFASAVTGGAVLRVAARVFWGWGPREEEVAAGSQDESPEKETDGGTPHVPAVMWAPAAALLLLCLMVGLLPGMTAGAEAAAEHFQDSRGYWRRMLEPEGARGRGGEGERLTSPLLPLTSSPTHPSPHGGSLLKSIAIGLFSAGLAAALALLTLFRRRLSVWNALPGRKLLAAALLWLKSLHSGHVGDYVAWLVAGAALYAFLCALLLRDA